MLSQKQATNKIFKIANLIDEMHEHIELGLMVDDSGEMNKQITEMWEKETKEKIKNIDGWKAVYNIWRKRFHNLSQEKQEAHHRPYFEFCYLMGLEH